MKSLMKKWFCNASQIEVFLTFMISFLACIRSLVLALTKNRWSPLVSSLVLLSILFILTFFRVKYSIIEKDWDKSFKTVTERQYQENLPCVKQNGNIFLVELACSNKIDKDFVEFLSLQTGVEKEKMVFIRREMNAGKEKLYIINSDAERLPFPEKPVSKSFVASLSPVYAKQAIFELFQ